MWRQLTRGSAFPWSNSLCGWGGSSAYLLSMFGRILQIYDKGSGGTSFRLFNKICWRPLHRLCRQVRLGSRGNVPAGRVGEGHIRRAGRAALRCPVAGMPLFSSLATPEIVPPPAHAGSSAGRGADILHWCHALNEHWQSLGYETMFIDINADVYLVAVVPYSSNPYIR